MGNKLGLVRPVILCGGAGTRLWPLSRQLFPKQLLPLTSEQSLLQQTAMRVSNEVFEAAIVVSGEDHGVLVKRQLEDAGTPVEAILLEPSPRNTAAAVALAAVWLNSTGRDELLLVVPSDHMILNRSAFLRAIALGAPHAEAGAIVTFGAEPTEPNTQYGYIEANVGGDSGDGAFPIARFVEKPNADKAAEYLASGRFYWNAGIFLLKSSTLLEEMRKFLPQSLDAITEAVTSAGSDGLFVRPQRQAFERTPNISIDHGIMEKTAKGIVVPVHMDWSDVGAWDAVWKLGSKDANGNVTKGDVVALDTVSSLLRSERGGPLVAAIGLDHIAVVATADAVFISPLDRVSEVKDVVQQLKAEGRECVISPSAAGPRSSFKSDFQSANFQITHLVVDPGETLCVQNPSSVSKHWVIVRGTAEITIGKEVSVLRQSQGMFIPAGTRHGLVNSGKLPLELVEVECGSEFGLQDVKSSDHD